MSLKGMVKVTEKIKCLVCLLKLRHEKIDFSNIGSCDVLFL